MSRFPYLIVLAVVGTASITTARQLDQFDLVCRGTQKMLGTDYCVEYPDQPGRPPGCTHNDGTSPYAVRLRIDLKEKRFCRDNCGYIFPITHLDRRRLEYLYDVDRRGPDHAADTYRDDSSLYYEPQKERIEIYRNSLRYYDLLQVVVGDVAAHDETREYSAKCVIAPFSGIKLPQQ
ncbi:MAG: hypothetical protein HY243_04385 [Proteobacteria bacterium]|nr:hypothetical protein [Pseudomonadota bacterium]